MRILFPLLCSVAAASTAWIAPGAIWYDTDGKKIDAHGGGIVKMGSNFYWSGHSAENQSPMMYLSTDLLNWKNFGSQDPSVTGMWRPKIAKPNGDYWKFWAASLSGPWNGGTDIAPASTNTYGSQNSLELTITGSKQTTYIYMGDAWDSKGGPGSNYVWLPMAVDANAKTVTLQYHSMWRVDINTGEVSTATSSKRYEAEHADISGRAVHADSEVTFYNITGTGRRQWLTFHYTVSSPEAGDAYIFINDSPTAINMSDLNSRAGYHNAVPVYLVLRPGDVNTVRFGASGSHGFNAIIDAIELHDL
ncbi:glycoside hydrolase family 43 protein [Oidiodendron maius Zn]|uniref:Glycoside hydrolase family 43 protein n=1 Tax=Oidiodendron maius (strain Zn) TaxID=913774 RepID=A0A0C3H527_OIDMZ|nr:glycoside hydrolase family 43 protein [Oidiodendron maius Zn]